MRGQVVAACGSQWLIGDLLTFRFIEANARESQRQEKTIDISLFFAFIFILFSIGWYI